MTGRISAEEGALRRGAEIVAEVHSDIAGSMARVQGELDAIQGLWRGDAAGSYTTLMRQWDVESRRINSVLLSLEDALRVTERDQAAVEENHQTTISGLGSMMGGK